MEDSRAGQASVSRLARLPPHAIHAAAFQPLAARQQTGFDVAEGGRVRGEQAAGSPQESPVDSEDDEVAELTARKACASMVETIAEGKRLLIVLPLLFARLAHLLYLRLRTSGVLTAS